MITQWRVAKAALESIFQSFPEIHPVVAQLLFNRGITSQREAERFLTPDYETDSHDPFLFKDMEKAVTRILKAVDAKEQIVIYGDYDADGVCASALLFDLFQQLGVKPHVHLPHREKEGYGMNMAAVKECIQKKKQLVVTCDCGITSQKEIAALQDAGVDVIVTDHHVATGEIPPAFAVLDPSLEDEPYPFSELVGTGVAFKLAQAVLQRARSESREVGKAGEEKWLLDLVAIATIADFGDLIDENRTYTKFGLVVLNKTRREGLVSMNAFLKNSHSGWNAERVAFQLVPRLNAASRMDHANSAFDLLIEKDHVKALERAQGLHELNQDRQKVSEQMYAQSRKQIGDAPTDSLLVSQGEGWQAGVVGLVAGKLTHVFNRPVLVIGINGGEIVGSGRSIPQFNITEALGKCAEFLEKFGGHAQACGFTVKPGKLKAFIEQMKKLAQVIKKKDMTKELDIDAEIPLGDVSWELWDQLQMFEPFGEGNPEPVFSSKDVEVENVRVVGSTKKHLQLTVHADEKSHKTIAFGFADEWAEQLTVGTRVHIAYSVSMNEWNGNRELQLSILDIQKIH